jgi:hypothetical protein
MTMNQMTASSINGQVARPFQVGDIVSNFNAIVRIHAIDEQHGLLVSIIPWQRYIDGAWIQQAGIGQNYFASADKCALVQAFAG